MTAEEIGKRAEEIFSRLQRNITELRSAQIFLQRFFPVSCFMSRCQ